ncbi:MAG: glycosyltransferase [Candidatus Desulforudis sp.]|nr:glycosyltransferase [Desulforudis sp.]
MHQIAFVVVNYGDPSETEKFVMNVQNLAGSEKCLVVIVDNESTRESQQRLQQLESGFSHVEVINLEENLFYWGGARFALDHLAKRSTFTPQWIIVCNNDIEIVTEEFINDLLSLDYMQYGVIAPSIVSTITGRDQNPYRVRQLSRIDQLRFRLQHAHYYFGKLFFWTRKLLCKFRSYRRITSSNAAQEIYAPHGSFVIFSKRFFEMGGYLDGGFRMYGEELTTAEIAKGIGASVLYSPFLKILHREHSTTGSTYTRQTARYNAEAYKYFVSRYLKP